VHARRPDVHPLRQVKRTPIGVAGADRVTAEQRQHQVSISLSQEVVELDLGCPLAARVGLRGEHDGLLLGRDRPLPKLADSCRWATKRLRRRTAVEVDRELAVPADSVEKLEYRVATRAIRAYERSASRSVSRGMSLCVALKAIGVTCATCVLQLGTRWPRRSIEFFNRIGQLLPLAIGSYLASRRAIFAWQANLRKGQTKCACAGRS
jgi:hypothetical protein